MPSARPQPGRPSCGAASRSSELLVVIAIICHPGRDAVAQGWRNRRHSASRASAIKKQLVYAWILYAGDYDDKLVVNANNVAIGLGKVGWVNNVMKWDMGPPPVNWPQNYDATFLADALLGPLLRPGRGNLSLPRR